LFVKYWLNMWQHYTHVYVDDAAKICPKVFLLQFSWQSLGFLKWNFTRLLPVYGHVTMPNDISLSLTTTTLLDFFYVTTPSVPTLTVNLQNEGDTILIALQEKNIGNSDKIINNLILARVCSSLITMETERLQTVSSRRL